MRLLFLTSRLPFPTDRGDRIRVFNFLKHLATEHEITLLSFIASEAERSNADHLGEFCRGGVHLVRQTYLQSILAMARNAWRPSPLQVSYYRSRKMRHALKGLVSRQTFDVVYTHLFRMAPYATDLPGTYRILDLTDVISMEIKRSLPFQRPWLRALLAIEGSRIEKYECQTAEAFDEVWLVSDRDRNELRDRIGDRPSNLRVIPIAVDPNRFCPLDVETGAPSLVFVGNMSVLHNIDAARYLVKDILPLVLEEVPEARVTLVGADPGPRVLALGHHDAVTVAGFEPDLNHALNRALVFVAPLRFAAGQQNKILEAMAAGRAVVTTRIVNDGIGATPGRDLLVADDEATFAAHVVTLLRDAGLRHEVGSSARHFVSEKFRGDRVVDRLKAIQDDLSTGIRRRK